MDLNGQLKEIIPNVVKKTNNQSEDFCSFDKDPFFVLSDFLNTYDQIINGKIDITGLYPQWFNLALSIVSAMGEGGRKYFHGISQIFDGYSYDEADHEYDKAVESKGEGITISTFFFYARKAGIDTVPRTIPPSNCFSDDVYKYLPLKLQRICFQIPESRKRDIFLMGVIAAFSSAASRWRFIHGAGSDVREYSPHLYILIIGPAGVGKSGARYGAELIKKIAFEAVRRNNDGLEKYNEDLLSYNERKKQQQLDFGDPLPPPAKPKKIVYSIAIGDTSQASLVEVLNDNPMGCFAYEPEIDSMVDGNKKDFGGISDLIRKISHHEQLNRLRKGNDTESYIVYYPRLAFVLCGTNGQLKKMIPLEEDGLFSRMFFYIIPQTFQPYMMATEKQDIIGEMINQLVDEVYNTANLWEGDLIYLSFTDEQERELVSQMQDKEEMEKKWGASISASWFRMGLIVKRIAITLAAFENIQSGNVPENCWRVAMAMLPSMKQHCIAALNVIREREGKKNVARDEYLKLKAEGLSEEKISKKLGITRKTLQAKRKEWDLIESMGNG